MLIIKMVIMQENWKQKERNLLIKSFQNKQGRTSNALREGISLKEGLKCT